MKYFVLLSFFFALAIQSVSAQQKQTLTGEWKGSINIQSQQLPIKTEFSKDGNSYTGNIHLQGVTLPLQKIYVDKQDSVRFQFTTNVNTARFKGTFKNDSTISGHYYQAGQEFTFNLKRYTPKDPQHNSQESTSVDSSKIAYNAALAGRWKGEFSDSTSFETYFQYSKNKYKGVITIQSQRVLLSQIYTTKKDSVFFYFAPNGGAHFKGFFQNDSLITGDYYQNGGHLQFKLNRVKSNRDTHKPEKPKPYHHKDVIIKNDSIDIGGTLTRPKNKKSDQLVIMISGSGAQDRNESAEPVTNFKPFAELADLLTVNGIATFRYDDRGVGESTGNFGDATLDILASDVEAIIHYFKTEGDQAFDKIILLGHSQGGMVAGKVAAENEDVSKLILMASPGINLKKVLHYQVKQAFTSAGITDSVAEDEIQAREKIMSAIRRNKDVEGAKKIYHKKFKAIQINNGGNNTKAEQLAERQTNDLAKIYSTPQVKSLLFYDPTEDLKKLHIPVLALFGSKDTQVLISKNKAPIEHALETGGAPYQIKIIKDANHLFQKAKTGQVQEYGTLPSQFVDGFISTIEQWLKQTSEK